MPSSCRYPYALCCQSPVGPILLTASEEALHGAWFLKQRHFPQGCEPCMSTLQNAEIAARMTSPLLEHAVKELQAYFAGTLKVFSTPLQPQGTPFQEKVWQALLHIPYGGKESYSGIAAAIGKPSAVRAVGGAIGRNPIGIFVPCHRVLGKSGTLTGYAGGLEKKEYLLRLEGQIPASVF